MVTTALFYKTNETNKIQNAFQCAAIILRICGKSFSAAAATTCLMCLNLKIQTKAWQI